MHMIARFELVEAPVEAVMFLSCAEHCIVGGAGIVSSDDIGLSVCGS